MKAVILAAGKGTRMWPLTEGKTKVLLPVAGRPFLHFLLQEFIKAGFDEIGIVVGHGKEQIEEFVKANKLKVTLIEQKEQLGTANAIAAAEIFTKGEDFVVTMGDGLYSAEDLKKLVVDDDKIYVACHEVEDATGYGVVVEKDGSIESIVEKPDKPPSNLINLGAYKFTPKIFEAIKNTKLSSRKEYEITDSISMLCKEKVVKSVEFGKTPDFSNLWDILEINELLLAKVQTRIEGKVSDRARIIGPAIIEAGAEVKDGAYIEGPCYIGKDSVIGPNCFIRAGTFIGENCKVGNACEIKNSVIMSGTKVPHLSYIGDSIIGENCNIGAGTITANLRFDHKNVFVNVRGMKIDSEMKKFGTVIGHNSQTGVNVSILPGKIIGCNCLVWPGMVVSDDIPSNDFLKPEK